MRGRYGQRFAPIAVTRAALVLLVVAAGCQAPPTPIPTPRTLGREWQPPPSPIPTEPGDGPRRIELLGYLGSAPIGALQVAHNRAYLGAGRELIILDVTYPRRAPRLGQLVLESRILDLAVSAEQLHAATDDGLYAVDVSDPAHPKVRERLFQGQQLHGLAALEGYVYVSAEALYVLQIGAAGELAEVSRTVFPEEETVTEGRVAALASERLYTVFYDARAKTGGLRILDVSDPSAPAWLGRFVAQDRVHEVQIAGTYAYMLVGEQAPHLVVVDVSNPAVPLPVQIGDGQHWLGEALVVSNGHAYLAYAGDENSDGGLLVLDLQHPQHPTQVGHLSGLAPIICPMTVWQDQAYIGAGDRLIEVNVSDPQAPAAGAEHPLERLSATARDFAVRGAVAYVAAGRDGLQVVDYADPANPRLVRQMETPGHAWAIELANDLAVLAVENAGLLIYDTSEPANPVQMGVYDVPGPYEFFHGLALSGSYAFVADGGLEESGLRVFDVSDPREPTEVSFSRLSTEKGLQPPARAEDVAVEGEYAYLAAGTGGVRVYRVSDPTAPVEVARFNTPGRADSVCLSEGRLYLVDGDLRILDVADPAQPIHIGFYDLPLSSHPPHVAVRGPRAMLTGDRLRLLDVSDSDSRLVIDELPLPGGPVLWHADRAYVLADGLLIFGLR